MDKTQKKAMVAEWKERHPEMGVVSVKCTATGEQFYEATRDTATWFNRHRFQLNWKHHRNKRLQELWNRYGENGFALAVVSDLEYEEPDEVGADELRELLKLCLLENPEAKKL